MYKRRFFLPIALFFLVLSLIVFTTSQKSQTHTTSSLIHNAFAPLQTALFVFFQKTQDIMANQQMQKLTEENATLTKKLVDQKTLQEENTALREQFKTEKLPSKTVLPATIVGAPRFIPNVSAPEFFIVDKGLRDGVQTGQAVVYKDTVVGKIEKTTNGFSQVSLVNNKSSLFTAKTVETAALGVIKGQGNDMMLDNVVLSDQLRIGDVVITGGDIDVGGKGYPPDLIVGKITGIEKEPSALFQKARVKSLLNFEKLTMVFIVVQK